MVAQKVKNLLAVQETWVDPWIGKIPWRRAWQPTPVLLTGESPWTEEPGRLHFMGLQRVGHDWATKHSTAQYSTRNYIHYIVMSLMEINLKKYINICVYVYIYMYVDV